MTNKSRFLPQLVLVGLLSTVGALRADPVERNWFIRSNTKELLRKEESQQLGLSAEQEKKVNRHRAKQRKILRELAQQHEERQQALLTELRKNGPDQTTVNRLTKAVQETAARLVQARVDDWMELRKILQLEQFARLMDLAEKRAAEAAGKREAERAQRPRQNPPGSKS